MCSPQAEDFTLPRAMCASQHFGPPDFRNGSFSTGPDGFAFRIMSASSKKRKSAVGVTVSHSITLSARTNNASGTVTPYLEPSTTAAMSTSARFGTVVEARR
jgi:hypothetical protein